MTPCRCGHPQTAHEHYTVSEHCAVCTCPDYSNPDALKALLMACAISAALLAGVIAAIVRAIH